MSGERRELKEDQGDPGQASSRGSISDDQKEITAAAAVPIPGEDDELDSPGPMEDHQLMNDYLSSQSQGAHEATGAGGLREDKSTKKSSFFPSCFSQNQSNEDKILDLLEGYDKYLTKQLAKGDDKKLYDKQQVVLSMLDELKNGGFDQDKLENNLAVIAEPRNTKGIASYATPEGQKVADKIRKIMGQDQQMRKKGGASSSSSVEDATTSMPSSSIRAGRQRPGLMANSARDNNLGAGGSQQSSPKSPTLRKGNSGGS